MQGIEIPAAVSKQCIIDDIHVSFFDTGKGSVALLFLHGSFITKEYWNCQITHFSKKYRVVAPDLPGHGRSQGIGDQSTIEAYGKIIGKLMEKLDLDHVIILGHSMGADVMLELASRPEVKGMIAIDYFKDLDFKFPEEMILQLEEGLRNNFSETSENYAVQGLLTEATDENIARRVREDYRQMNPQTGFPITVDFFHFGAKERQLIQDLEKRMYLINVSYRPNNENALRKYFRSGYELVVLEGTCHFPMIEIPEKLNEAIQYFLDKIGKV